MDNPPKNVLRKPEPLRSHVENFLREAIMSGRFKPGERLKERELCELLDVSRPSVREALRKLEAEKLITTVLHRGPVVASVSESDARELYALRALLEGYAVHEFTRLADAAAVARLDVAVKALHQCARKADRNGLLAAKSQFYDVILGNCGNRLVQETLLGLLSRINLLRATSFSGADRLRASLKEIDQLVACIKARDPVAAQLAAQYHIQNAERTALAVLREQQASDSANR
jgi:DNA-binding GntR family transcriptional regulator